MRRPKPILTALRFAPLLVVAAGCAHAAAPVRYVIEGRVVDAHTGEPLPGIGVHVHWPDRMQGYGAESRLNQVWTGPRGRFWVARTVPRPASYCACGLGRPCSVDPGSAVGAALTLRCPTCGAVSVGVGKDSMDFLVHGPGGVQVVRSVPRKGESLHPHENGSLVVRYELPDIPVEPGRVPLPAPPPSPDRLAPSHQVAPPASDGDSDIPTI